MEKIKLNFALMCDYAFFGDKTKLNVIGIFQNIIPSKFPYVHPQMFVVVNISFKDEGQYKQVIRLIKSDSGSDVIPPLQFDTDVKKAQDKVTAEVGIVGQLNAIKFDEAGEYKFKIEINDQLLSEFPLTIGL